MSAAVNNGEYIESATISLDGGVFPVQEIDPPSIPEKLTTSRHVAQFYESESFLLESMRSFIAEGFAAGEAGIVIATPDRLVALAQLLEEDGYDLAAARADDCYIEQDAAALLTQFVVDGVPDVERLTPLVTGMIQRAARGTRPVRVYGEMVALLWADGYQEGALALEELWNGIQQQLPFSLLCAYPLSGFDGGADAQRLHDICASHSHVVPAESYSALDSAEEQRRAVILLQQKAQLLEAEIAERQSAEEALRAAKADLEAQVAELSRLHELATGANRLKDEFLATVSHELRTPLTTILGWSQRLRSGRRDEATIARGLEIIERSARAQAQVVEDILDVSRVMTGKLRLRMEPLDAVSVINEAIDAVQSLADAKRIAIEMRLDPSARHICGDAARLQQVFWNILSNAIKFTPAGGHVEVRLERVDSRARISVTDTGEGFHESFLPHIFDYFRQADGTSTRQHGGLGLGLSLVRHLVELHDGSVEASSPGREQGATFTIYLPFVAPQRRSPPAGSRVMEPLDASVARRPSALEGIRVLVVDPDRETVERITLALGQEGASVHTAATTAEATALIALVKPDILISDAVMPGDEGFEFIRCTREAEAGGSPLAAVALTSTARVDDRARALTAGFDMFIPKPVESHELIAIVSHLAQPGSWDDKSG